MGDRRALPRRRGLTWRSGPFLVVGGLIGVLAVSLSACTSSNASSDVAGTAQTAAGTAHAKDPNRAQFGVFAGSTDPPAISEFARLIGRKPTYAMEFLDGSSWATIEDPDPSIEPWVGTGYSMIWSVPMLPDSGASLAVGATGAYNPHFVTLARAMVAGGQGSSIIRFGWEFNGSWYPWGADGHAAQFVAVLAAHRQRHAVGTRRALHVRVVSHPGEPRGRQPG